MPSLVGSEMCIRDRSAPALAGGPRFRGRTNTYHEEFCYRYKEQYVPGYYNKHGRYVGGYVKSKKERVPCWSINRPSYPDRYEDPAPNVGGGVDDNSCVEGAVLGGILGGGAGAAASRGDGRWWAIPLGIVGGSMLGCQVDGG